MYIKAMTGNQSNLDRQGKSKVGKAPETVVELMPRMMKLLEPMIKVTVLQAETEDELAIGSLMREKGFCAKNKFFLIALPTTRRSFTRNTLKILMLVFYDRYGNISQERLLEEALRRIDYEVRYKTGGYEHEYLNPKPIQRKRISCGQSSFELQKHSQKKKKPKEKKGSGRK